MLLQSMRVSSTSAKTRRVAAGTAGSPSREGRRVFAAGAGVRGTPVRPVVRAADFGGPSAARSALPGPPWRPRGPLPAAQPVVSAAPTAIPPPKANSGTSSPSPMASRPSAWSSVIGTEAEAVLS